MPSDADYGTQSLLWFAGEGGQEAGLVDRLKSLCVEDYYFASMGKQKRQSYAIRGLIKEV